MLLVRVMLFAALFSFPHPYQPGDFSQGSLPHGESGIKALLGKLAEVTSEVRYFSSNIDLIDDGTDEVIAYVYGKDACGSGGCNRIVCRLSDGKFHSSTPLAGESLSRWAVQHTIQKLFGKRT